MTPAELVLRDSVSLSDIFGKNPHSKKVAKIFFSIILTVLIGACSSPNKNENPEIFNLIAPDSLEKGSPDTSFLFVSARDPQGLEDIAVVSFTVDRPDGSTNGFVFPMHDDGEFGDSVAGDGVFSLGFLAPDTSNQSGDYVFHFSATDRSNHKSNVIDALITAYDPFVPEIYNLIAPDSLRKGARDTVAIFISVSDPQGLEDIAMVFFTVTRPDGSTSPDTIFMADDGQSPDSLAGDGLYSYGFPSPDTSQQSGEHVFHFTAVDNADHQSETIDKAVVFYDLPPLAGYREGVDRNRSYSKTSYLPK